MIFSGVKSITIPEGKVKKITSGGVVLWEEVEESGLPSIYQQVEWVQAASGVGAYLDLGFSFDKAMFLEIGLHYTTSQSQSQVFGAAENSGKLRCAITAPYTNGSASFYGSTGSEHLTRACAMVEGINEFEFALKKGELTFYSKQLDVKVTDTKQVEYTMTSNLLLFAQMYNGTPRYAGARRVYYFKYYDKNNTLICDLVPCYRKSDGVIGMYDLVRRTFLTNVGSGNFTKGADV